MLARYIYECSSISDSCIEDSQHYLNTLLPPPPFSSSFHWLFVLLVMILLLSSLKMPVIFYFSIVPAPSKSYQSFPMYYISSFISSALHLTQIQVSRLTFMSTPLVSNQLSLLSQMYVTFTFDYILWSSKAYHVSPCKL